MPGKTEKLIGMTERIPFAFQLDPKSDFETGKFVGIASVFGSIVDTFPNRTKFRPGAFLKSINDRGNRIKILSQHDNSTIWIGLPTRLQENETGLLVEASLNTTDDGRNVAEAVKHAASLGKLDAVELSIGFDAINFEMEEDGETKEMFRVITEARLWEISVVNFGADRQTRLLEAAKMNLDCSSGGLCKVDNREIFGASLSSLLDDLIDAQVDDDETRGEVVDRVGRAGGLSGSTLRQILRGEINCPPLRRMRGFARALGVSLKRLRDAAERDGCEYDDESQSLVGEEYQQGFETQTLIFPKSKWDSVGDARKWARDHDFRTDKLDETDTSFRFRQKDPDDFVRLRIICINPGRNTPREDCKVSAVGGPLKEDAMAAIESILEAFSIPEGWEPLDFLPGEQFKGKRLSGKSIKRIKEAIQALNELLQEAAEPQDDDKTSRHALTAKMEIEFWETELKHAEQFQLIRRQ